MPGGPWSSSQNGLLSGLWGVFQSAVQDNLPTSDIWTQLRITASTYYYQSRGESVPRDETALEDLGRSVLSQAGVNAGNVSTYRMVAGNWLRSKVALANTALDEQISGNAVFVPPWATTTSSQVPTRIRARVNATWTNQAGEEITGWKTFEMFGPLTTPGALIDQASALITGSDKYQVSGLVSVNDYELEQI